MMYSVELGRGLGVVSIAHRQDGLWRVDYYGGLSNAVLSLQDWGGTEVRGTAVRNVYSTSRTEPGNVPDRRPFNSLPACAHGHDEQCLPDLNSNL